jgi:hypothetical protein
MPCPSYLLDLIALMALVMGTIYEAPHYANTVNIFAIIIIIIIIIITADTITVIIL